MSQPALESGGNIPNLLSKLCNHFGKNDQGNY